MAGKSRQNRQARKNASTGAVAKVKQSAGPLSVVSTDGKNTVLKVNLSKMRPPEKVYHANSFFLERRVGYSDLYFGLKNPAQRSGLLLHEVIVRMSHVSIDKQIKEGHQDFYKPIFKSNPVTSEHKKEFSFDIEEQFNPSLYQIFDSNFVYASHGTGIAEMMFYRISPSVMHKIGSGKEAVVPTGSGIEPQITVNMPLDLMSYVYDEILHGDSK